MNPYMIPQKAIAIMIVMNGIVLALLVAVVIYALMVSPPVKEEHFDTERAPHTEAASVASKSTWCVAWRLTGGDA